VAKDTGISQATLSDWKNGISVPKVDKLAKIADYLGVSLDYLLGR
jgi:transcriptional regulator with XRE-family HTH domain